MIVVEVCGGLGNQMFQYACGKALAIRNDDALALDLSWYDLPGRRNFQLSHFNIKHDKCEDGKLLSLKSDWGIRRWYEKVFHGNYLIRDKELGYDASVSSRKGNLYLQGYWQSEKYFCDCRDIIAEEFSLVEKLDEKNTAWANKILEANNTVSVHIRRGDYISIPENQALFVELSSAYYQNSLKMMETIIGKMILFVFTNDIPWARDNLSFNESIYFVDANDEADGWKDMYLMSLCNHNIIANSTFSWWGAWLNRNQNKIVIAPNKWFKKDSKYHDDIIPEGWIAIPAC